MKKEFFVQNCPPPSNVELIWELKTTSGTKQCCFDNLYIRLYRKYSSSAYAIFSLGGTCVVASTKEVNTGVKLRHTKSYNMVNGCTFRLEKFSVDGGATLVTGSVKVYTYYKPTLNSAWKQLSAPLLSLKNGTGSGTFDTNSTVSALQYKVSIRVDKIYSS